MGAYRWLIVAAVLSMGFLCRADVNLQELFNQAIAKGEKQVVLPSGVHRVSPSGARRDYHLTLRNAKDLEIQGQGTTLVFQNPALGGILFENCSGVNLRGVTIDWDPLPFTQGRIVAIDPSSAWCEIEVEKGYSDNAETFSVEGESFKSGAFLFDPATRLLKPGAWDMFGAQVTRPRAGVLRVSFKNPGVLAANSGLMKPGDLLAISSRSRIGVRFYGCKAMTVDGVTIWTAPGIALQEAGGDGGNRYRYSVTRGPAPAGDGAAARLLSSTADAFNSSGVRRGPVVENCVLEYQGDDGVAIHGAYALVTAASQAQTLQFSPRREMEYRAGDRLRLYDGKTYAFKGEARIQSIAETKATGDADLLQIKALWKQYRQDASDRKHFEVKLDQPLQSALGDLVCSPDCLGSGFAIRGNVIGNSRAQGIRVKADDGVIEDNKITNVTVAGIALGPEFSYWLESDYVRDVVVRNNQIRRAGTGGNTIKNGKGLVVGAITLYASTPLGKFAEHPGNQKITISGNSIDDCGGIGMLIACASDLTVSGNHIGATRVLGTMDGGKSLGIDPQAAVFVTQSQRVQFTGNDFSGKGVVTAAGTAEISQ